MKFLVAFLKTLPTVSLKIVPKTALNICSGFLLLSLVDFFQVYIHSRLSGKFSASTEGYG
jgi:hypothetical protein